MRILFLDDMEARHGAFRRNHIGHVVDHVHTAQEAIEALQMNEQYDIASLDHDLDERATIGQDAREQTGYDVVRHMVSKERDDIVRKLPKLTIVHSYNRAGARNMVEALQAAGARAAYAPFDPERVYQESWLG